MTKSLGQIAHEAGWLACEGLPPWENLTISLQVRYERSAQAVAAHLMDEDAPAVQLGPKLFSFASHQDWVNSASIGWKSYGVEAQQTVCVDQLGRVLGWGKHFAIARDEGQFPADVYLLRADMANPPQTKQPKECGDDR